MSGRLYDPVLGRFLSADPTLQAPANPQDFNRYSYCLNNPLRFTDPNGFGVFDWVSDIVSGICDIVSDVVHAIGEFVGSLLNSQILGLAAQIIVGVLTQGATLIAQMAWQAATAAAVAAASGGDFAHVVLAAGIAFVSVGAWDKVGDICKPLKAAGGWGENFSGRAESCVLHGAVGGTLSAAEGGSFKDGFLGAAVGDACSGYVNSLGKDQAKTVMMMERTAASGVIGGTVAVMTGGNFVDGAKSAAFAELFNDLATDHMETVANALEDVGNALMPLGPEGPTEVGETLKVIAAGVKGAEKGVLAIEETATTIYRVFGDGAEALGHSWTEINSASVANYRGVAGLPIENSGRFVAEGTLNDLSGVTYRQALPLHGNTGGLSEYLVPNPAKQIAIKRISGVNPEL